MAIGRGVFVWHSLLTRDAKTAPSFYRVALGWQANAQGTGKAPLICSVGNDPVADIVQLPSVGEVPSHWLPFVHVDDVDASEAQVRALGGMVINPATDMAGSGRFAVVADPRGAVFALFCANPQGAQRPPEWARQHGHWAWDELLTDDVKGAFEFYGILLGLRPAPVIVSKEPSPSYHILVDAQGVARARLGAIPEGFKATPRWLCCATVDSIESVIQRAGKLKAKLAHAPLERPGAEALCIVEDPTGALFGVAQFSPSS